MWPADRQRPLLIAAPIDSHGQRHPPEAPPDAAGASSVAKVVSINLSSCALRPSEDGGKVDSAGSHLDCSDSFDDLLDLSPASISFASPSRGGCRWFTPAIAGGPLLLVASKSSGPAPLLLRVQATAMDYYYY